MKELDEMWFIYIDVYVNIHTSMYNIYVNIYVIVYTCVFIFKSYQRHLKIEIFRIGIGEMK